MERIPDLQKLNSDILCWFTRNRPSLAASAPPPDDAPTPVVVHHIVHNSQPAAIQQVFVNNNNEPRHAVPAPIQHDYSKKEEKGPSTGQMLAAAGIFTATATGLAWLWNREDDLEEAQTLRRRCATELEWLDSLSPEQVPSGIVHFERNLLRLTLHRLDLEIKYRRNIFGSKLTGVGSAGIAALGSVFMDGFLPSAPGALSLVVCCSAVVLGFATSFAWSSSREKRLREQMEVDIGINQGSFEQYLERRIQGQANDELSRSRVYPDL